MCGSVTLVVLKRPTNVLT